MLGLKTGSRTTRVEGLTSAPGSTGRAANIQTTVTKTLFEKEPKTSCRGKGGPLTSMDLLWSRKYSRKETLEHHVQAHESRTKNSYLARTASSSSPMRKKWRGGSRSVRGKGMFLATEWILSGSSLFSSCAGVKQYGVWAHLIAVLKGTGLVCL